jgi:NADH-quinone oxidoreductase subunit L
VRGRGATLRDHGTKSVVAHLDLPDYLPRRMNPQQNWLLALLPLFPLIGAAINGLFGARIQAAAGKKAVHTIAIIAPALSAVVAWVVFFQLMGRPPEERAFSWVGWDWIVVGFADARWAYWVDPLSGMMLLIITTIGTMIHVYSTGYMADEPSYWRFFAYLNLFVSMMLILVLGDSFLLMFVGWEGVGLASYLLIGFYYKDLGNAASGMKAFVVNRFGDAAFVIGLFLLFWGVQGSWVPPSGADLRAAAEVRPRRRRPRGGAAAGRRPAPARGEQPGRAAGHPDLPAHAEDLRRRGPP